MRTAARAAQLWSSWTIAFVISLVVLCVVGSFFVITVSLVESLQTFGSPFALASQQLLGILLGSICFVIGLSIPTRAWPKWGGVLYALALLLLILVFVPGIGLRLNGAARWLGVGGFVFQPVELLKFSLIMVLASVLAKVQHWQSWLPLVLIPVGLIFLQPDLGSLLVVTSIGVAVYFLAGGTLRILGILAAVAFPLLLIVSVLSPYRFARLTTFFKPESDPFGSSFHVRQITLALGRGGLLGQGLGNSLQKYSYIPETTTDSIFAVVAEEVGFLGAVLLIGVFCLLILSGIKVVMLADLPKSQTLVGLGLLAWISIQVLLNLAAIVGLVPLTGIPLPFISYGRSSQLMLFLSSGIIVRMGIRSS